MTNKRKEAKRGKLQARVSVAVETKAKDRAKELGLTLPEYLTKLIEGDER